MELVPLPKLYLSRGNLITLYSKTQYTLKSAFWSRDTCVLTICQILGQAFLLVRYSVA